MLDQVLRFFEIVPEHDLRIMQTDQGLAAVVASVLTGTTAVINQVHPNAIVVQGDTATTMAVSLAAFFCRIPVVHLEAGLRTHDRLNPFPEEINRRIADLVADLYLVPTDIAKWHLLDERVPASSIVVTGNTVIDALLLAWDRVREPHTSRRIDHNLSVILGFRPSSRRTVLVTGHRRESFGAGFRAICDGLSRIARDFPQIDIIYPVHLNPRVREVVFEQLKHPNNIHLIDPLDYDAFVWLMGHCELILTDSGGVQEEAPSLNKPVLVMRDHTERQEVVEAGGARLVGTQADTILAETSRLLLDPDAYRRMAEAVNPYGDGLAAVYSADAIEALLHG